MARKRRYYCLYCYHELERPDAATVHCPACRRTMLKQDFELFWTRERNYRQLEVFIKAIIVLIVAAISWAVLVPRGQMHGFAGVGYAAGFPILLGFLLWDSASLITRRRSILRIEVVWPALVFTLGFAPPALFLFMLFLVRPGGSLESRAPMALALLGWAACWRLLSKGIKHLVARRQSARERYVERRMEQARARTAEA